MSCCAPAPTSAKEVDPFAEAITRAEFNVLPEDMENLQKQVDTLRNQNVRLEVSVVELKSSLEQYQRREQQLLGELRDTRSALQYANGQLEQMSSNMSLVMEQLNRRNWLITSLQEQLASFGRPMPRQTVQSCPTAATSR